MRLESYSVSHGCSQPLSSMVAGPLLSWFRMLCHLVSVFSKVLPCWAVSSAFPKDFVLLSWTATVPLLPFLQIFYVTWHFIFWLFTLKQLVKVSSYPGADYDHVPLYLLPQPLWWLLACLYLGEDHLKTLLAAYGFEGICKASICRICCGVSQQAVFLVQRTLLLTCLVLRQARGKVWGGGTICSCWDRIAVWELGLWWRQLYYPPPGLSLHFSPSLHQWVGVRQSPSPFCAPAVGEAPWWGTKDWEGSVLLPSRFFTCFCCLTLVERILPTILSSHEWSLKDFPRRCRYLLTAKGASSMSVWIKGRKNPQFFNGLSGQPMYNWHLL